MKLESWMVDYAEYEQGIPAKHKFFEKKRAEQHPYMVKSYWRLGHTPYPNGQYMYGKECFFVLNSIAYNGDGEMFKYCMGLLNAYQKLTRVGKIEQLANLESELYGKNSTKTIELMSAIHKFRHKQSMRKRCNASLRKMRERIKEKKADDTRN